MKHVIKKSLMSKMIFKKLTSIYKKIYSQHNRKMDKSHKESNN